MPQRLLFGYALPLLFVALIATTAAAADAAPTTNTPTLALVIDDVGYNLEHGRRAIALPGPVTVAILPFAPNTTALAELAASSKHATSKPSSNVQSQSHAGRVTWS